MRGIRKDATRHLCIPAIALVAALPVAALAAGEAYLEELRVTIYRDQLAVGSLRFADAAALETWLKTKHARVRALDNCESGPTPQLLAAVERFYPSRADALEVRTLRTGDRSCADGASVARDDMYLETDAAGRSIIP